MIDLADAIIATATLAALLGFFYGPWQRAAEDVTRQFLFERRARLFVLACDGKLSFQSEAYKNARVMMNAYIRFAHDLSWSRLMFYGWYFSKEKEGGFGPILRNSIVKIDDAETRKAVLHILAEATLALSFMTLMKSIIFAVPATILLLVGFCTKLFNHLVTQQIEQLEAADKSVVRKLSDNIQTQAAYEFGLIKAA
jgi:hypothetical protein